MPDLPRKTQDTAANGEYFRYLANVVINLLHSKLRLETEEEPELRKWYFAMQSIFAGDFAAFVQTCFEKKYPWSYVRGIIEKHVDCNLYWPCITYEELASLYPCEVLTDNNELETICDKVLADNPKSIVDYRKGKTNSLNHLKGQVMKASKGKADINVVGEILLKKLQL